MCTIVVMEFTYLAVLISHAILVTGDVQFLERHKGEDAVILCVAEKKGPNSPIGLYVFRKWLKKDTVLFKYTKEEPSYSSKYDQRIRVSGDPEDYQLNVTITDLRGWDSDCYHCQFVYPEEGMDLKINSSEEYFLHVDDADVSSSLDVEVVEACAGGSAVIPCSSLHGDGVAATAGVRLKRMRSQGPVEVLYHSKQGPAGALFPPERLQWAMVPGPRGMTTNLTLMHLQPEDSSFYSCEILLADRPGSSSTLGKHTFFVSVQGDVCGCSSYATLLYATSAAVGPLLLFLIVLVVYYRTNSHAHPKPQASMPIYEEMVGLSKEKRPALHLEEMDATLYSNSAEHFRPVNHYERSQVATPEAPKE